MIQTKEQIPGIRPYFEIDDAVLLRIADALESGQVSNNGPHLQRFEQLLAGYLDASDAVVVSTGSDGLLLALKALNLKPGKVVLPAYTYIATLNAVVHAGLEPVFCDIDPGTFTMDVCHAAELTKKHADVRCIIPVNVFGVHADLVPLRTLCDSAGAKLLYDNAHGFGTESGARRLPLEPDVQVYSLHATKTLPAVEGGIVVSNDGDLVATVKRLRNHGLAPDPQESSPGFNAKMDEIRAIIGTHSLSQFAETLARRRAYGQRLWECFNQFDDVYQPQVIPAGVQSNFQNLGVCCPPALKIGLKAVLELFKEDGVGVRSYFDPPMNRIRGFDAGPALPATDRVWQTLVSVPIHSRMSEAVLEKIEVAAARVAKVLRAIG